MNISASQPSMTARVLKAMGSANSLIVAVLLMTTATLAWGADGCKVLLCLASPKWQSINECVPVIHQVFRDLSRGRQFPICTMSGAGNSASHDFASPPQFCPPQYTRVQASEPPSYWCEYAGAITVFIGGGLFTRTWWSQSGDGVTEFSPAAKSMLGTWDTRFDDEYAAWLAAQPPVSPVEQP